MDYNDFKWTSVSNKRNALTRRYEPLQPLFLATMVGKLRDAVFFDIGANIGAYSLLLGGRSEISEVVAFEPNPFCFAELEKNVALNQLGQKIRCLDVALSDREGTAVFGFTSRFAGDGGLRETHLFSHLVQSETSVPLRTLDGAFGGTGRMIVLKIDVEGHELNVIKGAEQTFLKNSGFLQVEIHDASPQKAAVLELIDSLGWKPVVRIGADYYFSNLEFMQDTGVRIELIEEALASVVHESLHAVRPARREITPNVTLELSRTHADRLKSVLKSLKLRK